MSHKIFSHENSFRGLQEAIEAVLEDSDDDREYDLAIIPPKPSVVTDEEEQSDEDMVTSTLPRDFPDVKRWCTVNKEKTEVKIPLLFQNYNKGMGGVDELDQSISLYRIGIHCKK
ncbi:hypothetical protein JYU34_021902 [Plutella xylostella]|uniref:Uncharacterized protein n=1 Tax=Plutella xylostella TaxID=51655 RepID=A0ABQ7PRM2_PLUXY|nr:hypothetical protein JYU34_021902 [Plutella xylostella]